MHLRPYYKFQHGDITCLLNIEEMNAFNIDEPIGLALESVSSDTDLQVTPEIVEELNRLELIPKEVTKSRNKQASQSEPVPIRKITLFVTQNCNFKCTYCYGDGGDYGSVDQMTRETAYGAVDWLIYQSGRINDLHISFFGGEPFLNFPVVREVVEYAKKRGQDKGKNFEFDITTNLSLLDKDKLAYLKEQDVKPLVSFDGPREIQDSQRPFKDGSGSYDTVVKKINQLLAVFPETTCRATLMGETDPIQVTEALHDIGFSSTHITVASPSPFQEGQKRADRNFSGLIRMMESDAERFLENVENRNTKGLKRQKNTGFLGKLLGEFLIHKKKLYPCGAGRDYVAVSTSGDVFLCHRFVDRDEFKLGSIFSENLERKRYLKDTQNLAGKCKTCFSKYICAGGCYHDNLGMTNSMVEPAEDTCRMMKRVTELLAYIGGRLDDEDKAFLTSEKIIPIKPCPFDFP